jgi:hypothetical protein
MQCAVDHERARGGIGMLGECRRMFPDATPTHDAAKALAGIPGWDEDAGDPIPEF